VVADGTADAEQRAGGTDGVEGIGHASKADPGGLSSRMPACGRPMGEQDCIVSGGGMAIWWKRLGIRGVLIDHEATELVKDHGDQALEVARKSARKARNKRDLRQARHFARVALRIAEKQAAPEAVGEVSSPKALSISDSRLQTTSGPVTEVKAAPRLICAETEAEAVGIAAMPDKPDD
jgi:hypothetical protein